MGFEWLRGKFIVKQKSLKGNSGTFSFACFSLTTSACTKAIMRQQHVILFSSNMCIGKLGAVCTQLWLAKQAVVSRNYSRNVIHHSQHQWGVTGRIKREVHPCKKENERRNWRGSCERRTCGAGRGSLRGVNDLHLSVVGASQWKIIFCYLSGVGGKWGQQMIHDVAVWRGISNQELNVQTDVSHLANSFSAQESQDGVVIGGGGQIQELQWHMRRKRNKRIWRFEYTQCVPTFASKR